MRLAFVGLGKMGRSILKGALERGFLRPEEVGVLGRTPERSRELAEPFGVRPLTRADLGMAERVLIAVQPRDFPALAPGDGDGLHRLVHRLGPDGLDLHLALGAEKRRDGAGHGVGAGLGRDAQRFHFDLL